MNSKAKGKRGELLFCKEARKYGYDCRRGQQYCGIGGEDIIGLEGVHVEVKFGEKLDLKKAMEQAVRDSKVIKESKHSIDIPPHTHTVIMKIPIVAWKKNRKPWKIVMRYVDLVRMIKGMTIWGDMDDVLIELGIEDWFKLYKKWRGEK